MRDELLGIGYAYLWVIMIALGDALAFGVDPLRNVALAHVAFLLVVGGLAAKTWLREVNA